MFFIYFLLSQVMVGNTLSRLYLYYCTLSCNPQSNCACISVLLSLFFNKAVRRVISNHSFTHQPVSTTDRILWSRNLAKPTRQISTHEDTKKGHSPNFIWAQLHHQNHWTRDTLDTMTSSQPSSSGVFSVYASSLIDAPVEKVWSILLDFPSYKEWQESIPMSCLLALNQFYQLLGTRLCMTIHLPEMLSHLYPFR